MTEEQEERLVIAFESLSSSFLYITGSLERISQTIALHHEKTFPQKNTPAEAKITRVKTTEDLLKEDQGASGESLDEWTRLGPREAQWLKDHPEEETETGKQGSYQAAGNGTRSAYLRGDAD